MNCKNPEISINDRDLPPFCRGSLCQSIVAIVSIESEISSPTAIASDFHEFLHIKIFFQEKISTLTMKESIMFTVEI